jgi:hypothetical protein
MDRNRVHHLLEQLQESVAEYQSLEVDQPNNLSESDCNDLASSVIRGFLNIDGINADFDQCDEEDEAQASREAIGIKGFIIWTNILLLLVISVVFYLCKRPTEIERYSDSSSTEQEVSDISKSSQDIETTPEIIEVEDFSQELENGEESHQTESNDLSKSTLSFDKLETSDDMLESTPDDVLISDSSESLSDILNDDSDQSVLETALNTSAASLISAASTKTKKSTNFIKQNINKLKSAVRPRAFKSQTAGSSQTSLNALGGIRKSLIPVRSTSARTKLRESTC